MLTWVVYRETSCEIFNVQNLCAIHILVKTLRVDKSLETFLVTAIEVKNFEELPLSYTHWKHVFVCAPCWNYIKTTAKELETQIHRNRMRRETTFINVAIDTLINDFEFQLPSLVRLGSKHYFWKNLSNYNYLKNGIRFLRR